MSPSFNHKNALCHEDEGFKLIGFYSGTEHLEAQFRFDLVEKCVIYFLLPYSFDIYFIDCNCSHSDSKPICDAGT